MKLTPLDIKKQEFKNTFRGYDPLEVETFLEMVADEYEELTNERNKLKEEILTLKTQLKDFQQVEHTLKQTLMNAQESVNRARINTEKEANLILHEAELKAEKLLEKARRDLEAMKNELVIVRAQKESFAKRLKHLLQSQIELIEVLELDDSELDGTQAAVVLKKEQDEIIEKSVLEADEAFKEPKLTEQEIKTSYGAEKEQSEKGTPEIKKADLEQVTLPRTEAEPANKELPKVDLLKSESGLNTKEVVENKKAEVTNKLEEFLRKKEEDRTMSSTDFFNENQKTPAALDEILEQKKETIPQEKIETNAQKQPTSIDEFIEEQSKENRQIPDNPVEEQQMSSDEKKVGQITENNIEPNDLFIKRKEDRSKKRTYPDDDQMVF